MTSEELLQEILEHGVSHAAATGQLPHTVYIPTRYKEVLDRPYFPFFYSGSTEEKSGQTTLQRIEEIFWVQKVIVDDTHPHVTVEGGA
jgi:hypothetical protein